MVDRIDWPEGFHRRDIGWRAPGALLDSYAATGVDIDEGARAVERMRSAVERYVRRHRPLRIIAGADVRVVRSRVEEGSPVP